MKIILKSILLAFVFLAACSKESSNNIGLGQDYCVPDEKTTEIPPYKGVTVGVDWGYKIKSLDSLGFGTLIMNPNNENEFICYFTNNKNPSENAYYYFNLSNKVNVKKEKLQNELNLPRMGMTSIKWSRKNWLIFSDFNNNIFKSKLNGDSLTQLTFSKSDFQPEWNYDGTKFITYHIGLDGKRYNIVRDENGNITDSIQHNGSEIFSGSTSWQHPKYIIGSDFYGVFMYDYAAKQRIVLLDEEGRKGIGNLRWINEVECIHSGSSGIFMFNTLTKQNRQLRKTTNANMYFNVHILSNKQMIASRAYTELMPKEILQTVGTKSSICLLNPCDTVITEINLRQ